MFKYLLIILNSFFLFVSDLKGENVIHSIVTYNIKYDDRSTQQNSWIMRKEGMIGLLSLIHI